ncbi:MAG TPA: hypothetical protein VGX95_09370 [Xanthobacteraceae bacterium]|jgi:hypothetical protein|nr:hypothetical protein [Xanthobacteraceae bacterium]
MAGFSVDRVSLKVPGVSRSRGEGLAREIAGRLAAAPLPPGARRETAALDVRLRGIAGESDAALARRVAAEIVRQLGRTG